MSTKSIVVPEPKGPPTRIDDFRHALACKACVSTGMEESEARCYDPAWRCGWCDRIYDFSWREFDSPDLQMLRWLIELEAAKKRYFKDRETRADALLIHGNVALSLVDLVGNYFRRRDLMVFIGGYVDTATPRLTNVHYEGDVSEQVWLSANLNSRGVDHICLPDSRHSMEEVGHFYTNPEVREKAHVVGFVGTAPQMPFYALCHLTALEREGLDIKLVPLPVETGCPFGDDMAQVMFEIERIEQYAKKGWIVEPPLSGPILGTHGLY